MRTIATLITLLLTFLALLDGQAPVAAQEPPAAEDTPATADEPAISVSPICALQLSSASDVKAQAIAATADPDGNGQADAEVDSAAVMAALPPDWLDQTIRSCSSLDDWLGAHKLFPDALGDIDATDFVHERCLDRAAGLDVYATCQSVVTALATPAPVVEPLPTPAVVDPVVDSVVEPVVEPRPARKGPVARVSKKFRASIPSATSIRYFKIRGKTPFALITQNQIRSRPHCSTHEAIACVLMSWSIDIEKSFHKQTRRCSMKKVRTKLTSVVWLPLWVNRSGANPALVRWWRQVVQESAVHEAEHIRIQQKHLADFRREATGKSCGAATFFLSQAVAAANLAQAAFDEVEYQKPLPPIPLSLLD